MDSPPSGGGSPTRDPHEPVRRKYSAPSGRRDVDQFERTLRLKMVLWSIPGAVLGGAAGLVATGSLFGGMAGAVLAYLIIFGVVTGAGRAAGTLHNPSGRSTPHEREYSAAESLVVRGRYPEAVAAFEAHVAEFPDDPVPYLRLARIHRDHLDDQEAAVGWFKRALRDARAGPGQELLARRELIELYLNRSGEPQRAAPDLARLAEERPDTPEGQWAARELADLKERIRLDSGDGV